MSNGIEIMEDLIIKVQKLCQKLEEDKRNPERSPESLKMGEYWWYRTRVSEFWNTGYPLEANDPGNQVYYTWAHKGPRHYVSITRIDTEIIPKKGKEGFLIKGIIRKAKVDIVTQKVGRWYQKVIVVVTPTPRGVRYMTFEGKKPFFGMNNIWRACSSMKVDKTSRNMLHSRILERLEHKINILDIYPELKYFDVTEEQQRHSMTLALQGAMHPFLMKNLGSHSGAKAILNSIYSPSGEKRIQKGSFGGVGEIRNWNDLISAMLWCRALRRLDSQALANVSTVLPRFQNLTFYQESLNVLMEMADTIDSWFKYFGVSERTIQMLIMDITQGVPNDANWVRRLEYGHLLDSVRMFRTIRSRIVRRAILDYLRRNNPTMEELHNHISAEMQKMETENRKISVKKLSQFAGKVSDEIICVPPKQTHDLVKWGSEYNICIGSYADRVLYGQTYCMGFQKPDGTFWGFAEVSKQMELVQLLGKHNQHLPNEQRRQIEEYLKAKGVTVSKSYWGSN